jgi:Holliday junction DNA helicase RuvB
MSRKISGENKLGGERQNENYLDAALRPKSFSEYVGQQNIKDNLQILLKAATKRRQPPEHILFYGPPGLGKTTLAYLIAKEINSDIKVTSGPLIEKVGDIASIVTNLSPGDVLFIDEIHRLNRAIEEALYPAVESGVLNIILGKGPSARTIELVLPPFTLVAATTKIALVSAPLRSRFSGGIFRLDYYNESEIREIIKRSAAILGVKIEEEEAVAEIARRSRRTPRTANFLLKRIRDFAEINRQPINLTTVKNALALIQIDEAGLNESDRKILLALAETFGARAVGLNTLSAALAEDEATIEEYHEPYLMQIGFLERTPRGRRITELGLRHISGGKVGRQKRLI